MSVLIKLMNTPKQAGTYHALIRVYEEGHPTISVTEDNITTTYDMIPVPTPHGRLIDADELLETIEKNSYFLRGVFNSTEKGMFLTGIRQAVGEAPTIIEAENSSAIDDDVKKYCDYLKSETYDFCNRIENGEVSEE